MANNPSSTITRKIDLTTEEVVWSPSNSALPFTLRPSAHATAPIAKAMNGALMRPTLKCVSEIASLKPGHEDFRAHAAVEPGDQATAVECRHRTQECQQRQRDYQGDDARKKQNFHRVEPHGAQCVDFLAHLHGPELGRVGAARPARNHDGHNQHPDLAQHEDTHHVDDVFVGAELPEMEEALLGDDAADEEGDEEDDRHRLQGHAVQLMHRGGESESHWMAQNCHEREPQGTHHVHERDQVACDVGHAATQRLHGVKNLALRRPGLRRRRIEAVHVPQETLIPLGQGDDAHLVAARFPRTQQSFQQQRAIGVELLDGTACRSRLRRPRTRPR